jgi:long-chain-fatty-acid--CoA ligase ACSBG
VPLISAAEMPGWMSVNFARNYDLKASSIVERFGVVRPTLFLGVPRVWEKIQAKMIQKKQAAIAAGEMSPTVLAISEWGKKCGREYAKNSQLGGSGSKDIMYGVADALVHTKVKKLLGLDKCKYAFTGAAPISVDTLEYFASVGIWINEVYGMSECTGGATWSTDKAHIWGSCGWAVPGVEVKVFKAAEDGAGGNVAVPAARNIMAPTEAEQGELCYRGRNIMMGYLANPDLGQAHLDDIAKKTRETIDNQGWLHSGDKGCADRRGMFRVTGRYKELLIGAGGENIAPVPIEDNVKKLCPAISNVMMVGDKKPFNCMLVALKVQGATGELPGGSDLDVEALALTSGDAKPVTTVQEAMDSSVFIKAITDAITATNKDEACCPMNASKVQKFTIIPADFSVATDELTPTFKLKRSVVYSKYGSAIEAMYSSKETYVKFSG